MSTMQVSATKMGDASWVDGKRWLWLLSPALPLIGLGSVLAVVAGAPAWTLWFLPVFFYGLVPVLDWWIAENVVNAPESAVAGLNSDHFYLRIVYAYIPSQYLATIAGAWLAVNGDLGVGSIIGLIATVGIVNGVAINTAHELGHKTQDLERWFAKITLAPVAYGHFFVEHNRGHHKNVATPEDPASSKMGETFWAFLPRSVIGSLKSAWHIEDERLQRNQQKLWSVHNENLQAWAMTIVFFAAVTAWLGPWALLFLVVQAAFGASLLEVVNYLEHYGLLRQKLADGRYERCQPRHSWDSNHVVTNLFLYQLQRHSDHHANPTRRYQALRHFEDSPQLPSGYAAMILIAYLPPLWFRVMDPKVVKHHNGDLSRANLYAPRRAELMARWASAAPQTSADAKMTDVAQAQRPKVAVNASTRFQCPNCDYIYDPKAGSPHQGFAPGTLWIDLPKDWCCPDCSVREKPDFKPLVS